VRKIIFFVLLSAITLAGLFIYQSIKFSDNKLHIIFCDIGQGDGILIRTPKGDDIIVDGGPDSSILNCLSRHLPLWDRTIEVMYLTHPDSDHLTGLIPIIKTYNVKYFGTSDAPKGTLVFEELNRQLLLHKITKHFVFRGDAIKTPDGFMMTTFWPTTEFIRSGGNADVNYYSLIQEISYGKFHVLLDGDSPYQVLDPVMNSIESLDVFKPPHHGSKTGIDELTFAHLVPRLAVLSYGRNNRYHHPAPQVLELLKKFKIPYKDTLKGDVEIISDGNSWWVH
jgi:competence protein ComEC